MRKVRVYTVLGERIAALGKRQKIIAEALGVSQQTVSKKLRGETAILVSDLEKLAAHFEVGMSCWFPSPEVARADKSASAVDWAELEVAFQRIRFNKYHRDAALQLVELCGADARRALKIMQTLFTSTT